MQQCNLEGIIHKMEWFSSGFCCVSKQWIEPLPGLLMADEHVIFFLFLLLPGSSFGKAMRAATPSATVSGLSCSTSIYANQELAMFLLFSCHKYDKEREVWCAVGQFTTECCNMLDVTHHKVTDKFAWTTTNQDYLLAQTVQSHLKHLLYPGACIAKIRKLCSR